MLFVSCKTQVVYSNKYDQLSHEIEKISNLKYLAEDRKTKKIFRQRNIELRKDMFKKNEYLIDVNGVDFLLIETYDNEYHIMTNYLIINEEKLYYKKNSSFYNLIEEDYNEDKQMDIEFCIDMILQNNLDNLYKENYDCVQKTNIYIISNDLKIKKSIHLGCISWVPEGFSNK